MTDIDALIERLNMVGNVPTTQMVRDALEAASALAEQREEIARLSARIGAALDIYEIVRAERDALRARVAEMERGEILTDKELIGAVIECVMSVTQSNRDLHCRKLQRHILAVEEERDALLQHARALAANLEADGHCDDTRCEGCCHCEALAAFREWEAKQ